jgi:hypothetical protein
LLVEVAALHIMPRLVQVALVVVEMVVFIMPRKHLQQVLLIPVEVAAVAVIAEQEIVIQQQVVLE